MIDQTDIAGRILQDAGLVPAFDNLVIYTPEALPLIEPGEYEAVCVSCRKEKRFKRDLLAFKFKLTSQCQYFGMTLDGYINLDFGKGNTRKAPSRSKLAAWLRTIAAFDPSVNVTKFHIATFSKYLFTVKVESSNENSQQKKCEPCSRVTQILGVVGRLGGAA